MVAPKESRLIQTIVLKEPDVRANHILPERNDMLLIAELFRLGHQPIKLPIHVIQLRLLLNLNALIELEDSPEAGPIHFLGWRSRETRISHRPNLPTRPGSPDVIEHFAIRIFH